MSSMPVLPVEAMCDGLNDQDAWLVRAAFSSRGVPAGGRLRANKPFRKVSSLREGEANYVWRMFCFDLVGWGKHACMPVCADFEIHDGYNALLGRAPRDDWRERSEMVRDRMKLLDALVNHVESKLPVSAKKGILRWGRALGMIGV